MRVLLIIPSIKNGGAERVASYLSTGLPEDWKVDLLLRDKKRDYDVRNNCKITVSGGGIGGLIRFYKILKNTKKSKEYDIYNSHMASSNIINILTGNKTGKTVLTIHSITSVQMSKTVFGRLYNFIIKKFYKRADKIVAVSNGTKNDLCDNYLLPNDLIEVINNGMDIQNIRSLSKEPLEREDKPIFENRPVISAMGRYNEVKGHIYLIKAFSWVVKKYPQAKLVIIGEGDLRKKYEETAEKLNISANLVLTGFRNNPFPLIKNSDAFVFSSIYEGQGCALTEAMICGVPCVSVNYTGMDQVIMQSEGDITDNRYLNTGVICPAINENDEVQNYMTDGILKMIEDKDYAAKTVRYNFDRESEFSLEKMIEKWVNLFGSVGKRGENV